MQFTRLNRISLSAILFLIYSLAAAQTSPSGNGRALETTVIRGTIYHVDSGVPVDGANVSLRGTQLGSTTDSDGHFEIGNVPPGVYTLQASCVGYRKVIRENIRIDRGRELHLELRLAPSIFQLKEVTITPGSFSFMDTGSSIRQIMSRDDIESVPQFGEDIFRAVNRLPGLSSGDYSTCAVKCV